jgi:peptide/nickel transport system ATP-binding protein
MKQILSIKNLSVSFGEHKAVRDVTFSIKKGETVALVGESGSGKSVTALATVNLIDKAATISGSIKYCEKEIVNTSSKDLRKIRGNDISFIFQEPMTSLNPLHTIERQLNESLRLHQGLKGPKVLEKILDLLAKVGIEEAHKRISNYPHQLSGGQQQRVGLAMAFACRPSVIVLDEPTTGLDVSTQEHVLKTIRQLTRDHGVAALYITHDLAVVADLADDVAVMYAGRVVEQGTVAEIFGNPAHPYTRHLVAAAPDIAGKKQIIGLSGRAPSPGKRPQGCAFAPRCELASQECTVAFPSMVSVDAQHTAACIKIGKRAEAVSVKSVVSAEAKQGDAMVDVRGVSAGYSGNVVVHDVSFTVRKGECLALVGESGSGKTTISRAIGGLHREWTGSILLEGNPLKTMARQRSIADRLSIQYVFQNPYGSLNPRRTVGDSIARPLLIDGKSKVDSRKLVLEVLDKVNLPNSYANKYPDQLSGGERQRVAIARALVSNPQVLVCDEVTSALDVLVQAAIVDLLGDLRKQLGLAMLFVTHNLPLVRSIADEVAVMSEGRIVEIGSAESVIGNPQQEYTRSLITATPSIERSLR